MSVCRGRLATIMATSASVMAIARVVGVGPGGPANGAVLDDEGSHAAGVGDDLVVLSGVCRVAEDGREPFGADVDAAVHPVARDVGGLVAVHAHKVPQALFVASRCPA